MHQAITVQCQVSK